MSLASVGQSLGVSEEAARKLVDRGVSQLRGQLATANLSCTGAGLMAAPTAGAVTSAPDLAQLVFIPRPRAAGAGASAAGLSPLIKGTIAMMTWTKTSIAIAAVAAALLIGGGATTIAVYSRGVLLAGEAAAAPWQPRTGASVGRADTNAAHIDSGPADPVTTSAVRKTMSAVMACGGLGRRGGR